MFRPQLRKAELKACFREAVSPGDGWYSVQILTSQTRGENKASAKLSFSDISPTKFYKSRKDDQISSTTGVKRFEYMQ